MKRVKETVLATLARNEGYIGGEELATRTGASRAAVWKAVCELRAAGEQIVSDPKLGYALTVSDALTPASILRAVPSLSGVECHKTLTSTNDRARELAIANAPAWTVVQAESQSAGRGRFSRSFFSESGHGLFFSLLLRPSCPVTEVPLLTTCAAVAVAEAIESVCNVSVGIKWVNDLWVAGRKICGILTEGGLDAESGSLSYAVMGIGINVLHTDFPPAISEIATSLADNCTNMPSRTILFTTILRSLYSHLSTFSDRSFLESYRRRSVLDGHTVTVNRGDEHYDALVRGIGPNGELLLTRDGKDFALSSGEVVSVHPRNTLSARSQESKETR